MAIGAEEGRGKLRKAAVRCKQPATRRYPNGETLVWGCGPLTKQESDSRSCLERQTEEGNSPVREIRRRPSGTRVAPDT